MDKTYILIDTVTNTKLSKTVTLSDSEVATLNYAYALNTNGRKKYIQIRTFSDA